MADAHYTFVLDEKLLHAVEKIADENHRSIAGEIRVALEKLVEAHKEKTAAHE